MKEVRIATLGAAFSANKGAASMLQALIDNLPDVIGQCQFDILSTYPADDAREAPEGVRVVSCTPIRLLLCHFPLALAAAVASRLGIPRRWFCQTAALRSLLHADIVLDVAGISFVDGRGIPTLAYNIVMTSTPLLLGRPVVKVAQALGPFRTPLNRSFATLILPRLKAICARGASTETNLLRLGLGNICPAADLAFSMKAPASADRTVAAVLGDDRRPRVVVMPSSVVEDYARRRGIAYHAQLTTFIDVLCGERGLEVLLLPHAVRPGARASRMNDLPLCREVYTALECKERCWLVDDSLPPAVLRGLIATCEVAVTSRFHGMISALATATPTVVVGWSHKYREVLQLFGLEDQAIDYGELSTERMLHLFDSTWSRTDSLRSEIAGALPAVVAQSHRNYEVIARTLQEGR